MANTNEIQILLGQKRVPVIFQNPVHAALVLNVWAAAQSQVMTGFTKYAGRTTPRVRIRARRAGRPTNAERAMSLGT